jgi:predicted enzyme related to lactoylglutathione lyase
MSQGFVWYELLADDIDAAQAFYTEVIGWTIIDENPAPADDPGFDYRLLAAANGDAVAGLMQRPAGMPAAWNGYIGVDDVDAAVAAVETAGGAARMPAVTMLGVGRMALLADPAGTSFYVMAGVGEPSRAFQGPDGATPGHMVWNELSARDPDAAIDFYAGRFGWRQEGAMPMGALGDYRFIHDDTSVIGAVMGEVPGGRIGWLFYTQVDDIDAALARVGAAGGRGLQGPDPIPGGSFSLVAEDPWGSRFGLVGPRREGAVP